MDNFDWQPGKGYYASSLARMRKHIKRPTSAMGGKIPHPSNNNPAQVWRW